jgi:hypothetical protein
MPDRKGCLWQGRCRWSGFWLEEVAADGAVGRAQVAWFPGLVQGAESVGNVLRQLRAGGGVDGVGGK